MRPIQSKERIKRLYTGVEMTIILKLLSLFTTSGTVIYGKNPKKAKWGGSKGFVVECLVSNRPTSKKGK